MVQVLFEERFVVEAVGLACAAFDLLAVELSVAVAVPVAGLQVLVRLAYGRTLHDWRSKCEVHAARELRVRVRAGSRRA